MNYNPQFAPSVKSGPGYATEDQVKALTKQSISLKIGETMVSTISPRRSCSVLHMQLDYEIARESELMEIDLKWSE